MTSTTQRRARATPARFPRSHGRPPAGASRGATQRPGPFARPSQRSAARTTIVTRGHRRQSKPSGLTGIVSSLPKIGGAGSGRRGSSSGGMKGALASLTGLASGSKKRSSSGGGRKAGGAALLAGGAALALKNRDKLGSLLGKRKTEEHPGDDVRSSDVGAGSPSATPHDFTPAVVVSPVEDTTNRPDDPGSPGRSEATDR